MGDVNLIANYEPKSPAAYFAAEHGPSACGMGWRCRDAAKAYAEAIDRGAEPVEVRTGPMELRLPAIRGIGGAMHYLDDPSEGKKDRKSDGEGERGAGRGRFGRRRLTDKNNT